jgi:hypothetical protein
MLVGLLDLGLEDLDDLAVFEPFDFDAIDIVAGALVSGRYTPHI